MTEPRRVLQGTFLILSGEDCERLTVALRRIGARPLLEEFGLAPTLEAVRAAGRRWVEASVNTAARGSVSAPGPAVVAPSEYVTVAAAARALGIKERAVRRRCELGDLVAEKDDAGRWRIPVAGLRRNT